LSQSSSLEATKTNIDLSSYAEVRTIDFADFVDGVGKVALLKMDIEGHEIGVINHLIDRGSVNAIGEAFVELHDKKNPALKDSTDALRARIATLGVHFDLTWH
jgi:FkbM family methyltransferase